MPRERAPAACLSDMLQAAQAALDHIAGKSRQDYERHKLIRDAVERNIEIIGGAARRLQRRIPRDPS
ncbi:MAG: HepT-like ribonuclease domain-containing protein [Phycisphaeraceae bacterium]